MTRYEAAQKALDSHDALQAAMALEPPSNADGWPLDEYEWLEWRRAVSEPAYRTWAEAMDDLAVAVGESSLSRHPFNFRPLCEQIIAEAS